MSMEIAVPDDCVGDVMGDLSSRRGKVQSIDSKPGAQVVKAHVPMSEILKYAPDLTSMTSGRGSFTVAFSHYEELPAQLVDKVVKEAQAAKHG
jgi:elongation factor G